MDFTRQERTEGGAIMKAVENKICEAFDAVEMPSELKKKTLNFINEEAKKLNEQSADQGSSVSEIPEASHNQSSIHKDETKNNNHIAVIKRPFWNRAFGFAVAACVMLVALGFGGFKAYSTETAFVGIDVNPSIELGVNRFGHVVSEQAFNEDGQKVLEETSFKGMAYDEAIDVLSNNKVFLSYISDESLVEVSVVSDNEQQAEELQERSNTYLGTLPCEGLSYRATSDERVEAHAAHMGVGRYQAAIALIAIDQTVTLDDCRHMSMHEIRDRIIAAGGEVPQGTHHNGQGHGTGYGQTTDQGQGSGQGIDQGQGGGQGIDQGQGDGQSTNQGQGSGQDINQGQGGGQGTNQGQGDGQGTNQGQGDGQATNQGQGDGQGYGPGSGHRNETHHARK